MALDDDKGTTAMGSMFANAMGGAILTEGQDKVPGLFKRTIFPEATAGPKAELRQRLHQAIFTDSEDVEGRTVIVPVVITSST